MRLARSFAIGFFSFVCIAAIAAFIYLMTLETTILNRAELKAWLADGGIYKNNLVPSLLQANSPKTASTSTLTNGQFVIPDDALATALKRTFTQQYVRSQAEGAIDSFYDWVEGKTTDLHFSIPINEQKDTFVTELTHAVEPTVAALPICTPALVMANTACRPVDIAPDLYAQGIIAASVDKAAFFKQPLTPTNLTTDASTSAPQSLLYLRALIPIANLIAGTLVAVSILSAVIVVRLSLITSRLKALGLLGRRIFFGQLFTLLGSLFLLWGFQSGLFRLSSLFSGQSGQPAVLAETISNVVKLALVDIASKLALFSGIVCMLGLAIWIGVRVWQQRHAQVTVLAQQSPSGPDIPT